MNLKHKKVYELFTYFILPSGMTVVKGKALTTWESGSYKSEWAQSYYSDTTKVDTSVGLRDDRIWLPVYGLFAEKLPYLCRTQVRFN